MGYVLYMATYRRERGAPTVGMHMKLSPDVKALIDEYASVANAPQWAIVEAAIRAGKPGPNGLPPEWELETGDEQIVMHLDSRRKTT